MSRNIAANTTRRQYSAPALSPVYAGSCKTQGGVDRPERRRQRSHLSQPCAAPFELTGNQRRVTESLVLGSFSPLERYNCDQTHVLALHVTLTRIGLCARESTHHLTTCWPGHHGRRRHSSATMCYSTARSATGRTLASRPSPAPALPPPPLPPLGDAISRKVYAPRPRHQGMCATDTRRPWRTDQQEVRPPAGQRATARGLQEAQKLVSIPARWSRAAELRKEWMRPADGASAAATSHACSARSRRPSPRRTRAGGGG